jgi:23S rRNA U2552 (ribose-2'-O)-methylase RlmE/FtsJ
VSWGGFTNGCRLTVYMAATDTTTIRVSTDTRDLLRRLAARRGEPAGEVIAKLVAAADEEAMLAEVEASFERLAENSEALAAYRAESDELDGPFDAPIPEW